MSHPRRHSFEPATLSRAGVERRDQALAGLHDALDRRVARTRRVRSTMAAAVLIALAAGVWASFPGAAPTSVTPPQVASTGDSAANPVPAPVVTDPAPVVVVHADPAPPKAETPAVIAIIATDPDIVRRLSALERPTSVEVISDAALQSELASAGVEPGLVTIGGRTLLTLASGKQPTDPRP